MTFKLNSYLFQRNSCFTKIHPVPSKKHQRLCQTEAPNSKQELHSVHICKPELNRGVTQSTAPRFQHERSDKASRKIKYFLVYITTKIRQSPLSPGLGGLRGERLLRLFTNKSLFQFSIPRRQGRVLGPGRAGSSAAALQVPPGPAPAALVLLPQPPSPASLRR